MSLVPAGERGDKVRRRLAPVEEGAYVLLCAPQRFERRYPLQRLAAGDIENHGIPRRRGDRVRVLPEAPAAEIGPRILGRLLGGAPHLGVAGEPGHPPSLGEPVVEPAVWADVGV